MQAGEAKDKIVIITGAGRGIGRAIAERFGSEGSRVILADINKEAGENVADGIEDMHAAAQLPQSSVNGSVMPKHRQASRLMQPLGRSASAFDAERVRRLP